MTPPPATQPPGVLLTGGSGRLGSLVRDAAARSTLRVRVLSRRAPRGAGTADDWRVADLESGDGLARALDGSEVVLHLASDPRRSAAVDVAGTRNLVRACDAAGVKHLLYLSIIGVDAIPYGYYRDKLAAEHLVEGGRTPWTIVRAAQFHSFVDYLLGRAAAFPLVMPLPVRWKIQSVDDGEVARRLVALLRGNAQGRVPDYAGPEILSVGAAARLWRTARGVRKPVLPLALPGKLSAAFRAGRNTTSQNQGGSVTWAEYLARTASPRPRA